MRKFEVENHKPSYLPDGEWNLVWSDEFDGTELDTSKWDIRLNFWGKPFDAYTDQGIILDGKGNVELHRTLRNGRYVSPQLQTGSNSFDIPFVKKDEGGLVGTAGTIVGFFFLIVSLSFLISILGIRIHFIPRQRGA